MKKIYYAVKIDMYVADDMTDEEIQKLVEKESHGDEFIWSENENLFNQD